MPDGTNPTVNGIDRRSVLRRVGAASTVAFVGASAPGASRGESAPRAARGESSNGRAQADDERVLNEVTLDTSDYERLERASVTFLERGERAVVRAQVRAVQDLEEHLGSRGRDRGVGRSKRDADARPTKTSFSISIGPEAGTAGAAGSLDAEDVSALDASEIRIERDETAITPEDRTDLEDRDVTGQTAIAGVSDDPNFGSDWDGVAFVETNSSECGTLCRTNLVMDFSWSWGRRSIADSTAALENVDGATCDGDEFGDRFPCWSTPLYDCSVPDAFDTHWHTDEYDHGTSWTEASYSNSDFPLIPNTYADHYVEADVRNTGVGVYDYSVEHSATIGFGTAANYLLKSNYGSIVY